MRTAIQFATFCSVAALLVACGGSSPESSAPRPKALAARTVQGAQHAPSEYIQTVQSIYIGFFGRPADAKGLQFWTQVFSDRNLPLTLPELIAGYTSNPQISSTLDGFTYSQEFADLYAGDSIRLINALYLRAFNRQAESSGLNFWAGFLNNKQITPAQAVLWIVSGAQNDDAVVVGKKIRAATLFTSLLDTPEKVAGYEPQQSNAAARDLFATITATTDLTAFRIDIEEFIAGLQPPGEFPIVVRYAGYNYLQDLDTNQPLYAASYAYAAGGVVPPATTGSVTFGTPAQTVKFSRSGSAFTFDSPLVASAGIGGSVLPTISMLCENVATVNGNTVKSTDILIARSAYKLVQALELANQTFTVYRENCAQGGSNLPSFSFDSQGNGSFPVTSTGIMQIDAAGVTRILNGELQYDISTGKSISFAAYRYQRSDGSLAYAIVQHLGNRKSGLTDGILAVWAQE
ncbi:DUF4214 domain-containing protein [Duganella callida]|uniref:DUF4214 domain-containing protein n=1 Tax=Duganella callida TaxID=2561932 RepID=A0A4Y9SHL3_9BURK|nr:DUF4214 domain-containing protein [Duganella callida]TFW21173.1 DUF4214 domain-containing protein [Duganella callida]